MAPRRMFVQCRFDTSRCNAFRNVDEFRAQLKKNNISSLRGCLPLRIFDENFFLKGHFIF